MHRGRPRTWVSTDRVFEPDGTTGVAAIQRTSLIHHTILASQRILIDYERLQT
jgi:hypothetical protein